MGYYGSITTSQVILGKSLGEIVGQVASIVPGKIAIKENNRSCTYDELNTRAEALAAGLAHLGVRKGDCVAILLPNSIETIIAYLGVAKAGAVTMGLNYRYREKEIRFMLENSGARAIITINQSDDYNFISVIKDIQKDIKQLQHIITIKPNEGSQNGIITMGDLIEKHMGEKCPDPGLNTSEDLIILLYTSGTTGVPKGAMTTHYQAMKNASLGRDILNVTADDVVLSQLPWFHSLAYTVCLNMSLVSGACLVIQEPYSPVETLKAIEEGRVTIHNGTPAMFIMEMDHRDFKKYDLSSLRSGVAAGAAFSPHLLSRINEEMGFNVTSMFGMTETCGIATTCQLNDSAELKTQTVGKPIPGCRVKICNSDGLEVPIGEVGELWYWGWNVTKGYWNNDVETKKQLTEDGWLKTGDQCRILENGYVQYISRLKELINKGGYKIYPNELEGILLKHPKITEVAVVGMPNKILGELVCACVIPKDKNNIPDITELREYCKDIIADYKMPDELCIMDDFPRTASGKIRKFGEGGLVEVALSDEDRQKHQRKK